MNIRILFLSILLLTLSVGVKATSNFTFTEIADTKNDFSGIQALANQLGMNNKGEVAFSVNFIDGSKAVYKGSGNSLTLIRELSPSSTNQLVSGSSNGIGINENSVVAFTESIGSGRSQMFSGSGGSLSPLTDGSSANLLSGADINNLGQVAFYDDRLVVTDGVSEYGVGIDFNTIGIPVINQLGEAVVATLSRYTGEIVVNKISPVTGLFDRFVIGALRDVGIQDYLLGFNNRSNISYSLDGDTRKEVGLLTETGFLTLLDTSDGFARFLDNTSLNDYNQVLFAANRIDNGLIGGLYLVGLHGNPPNIVVEVGDEINGKIIQSISATNRISVSTSSLNLSSQVAFVADVTDVGSSDTYSVLFRADPLAGISPEKPLLPGPDDNIEGGGWLIPIPIRCQNFFQIRCFIDPEYAQGYQFGLTSDEAPSFESVLIPAPLPGGDDTFELIFNGISTELVAGTPIYFTDWYLSGVRDFIIQGISVDEQILPDDFTAFVTGITFVDDGTTSEFSVSMIPIVDNSAPTLGELAVTTEPLPLGNPVYIEASVSDPDTSDNLTARIEWGDGTYTDYAPLLTTGAGTLTGTHSYSQPGVYTIDVTLTDIAGAMDTASYSYVAVYDPSAGFVTGGGWFDSPAGAYIEEPELTGKAQFGFVAKYKKGKSVPDGNTQFQFKAGGLNFHSTVYDWLVIAGAKALFKGVGQVNGTEGYGFILSAKDGDLNGEGSDSFRIKIWRLDTEEVIYDNQLGAEDDAEAPTTLGGGSIVVHSAKKK
ncbi:PKD domain-containing protein [Psychromonas sp.]|uniref:PKD domain-containing protein n=1 Tax=Psychromonas sp. TaxID=1884585 RepID=UPI0035615200